MNHWTKELTVTCWPVGQGLFTQADVRCGDRDFRIVYDCGTSSPQQHCWSAVHNLPPERLDLLVLSHYDLDHISGVAELLDHTGGTDRVWVPYIAPELRWLQAIRSALQAADHSAPPTRMSDAAELVVAPEQWFARRGPSEISRVGDPRKEGPDHPPPHGDRRSRQQFDAGPLLRRSDGLLVGSTAPWRQAFKTATWRTEWSLVTHPSTPDDAAVLILTWAKPGSGRWPVAECRRRVARVLGVSEAELLAVDEPPGALIGRLQQVLGDEERRKRLRECYGSSDQAVNNRSLFLMVQAGTHPSEPWRLQDRVTGSPEWIEDRHHGVPTALWCGDAGAKVLEELLAQANNGLRLRLGNTTVWGVPHHGSAGSYCAPFYRELGPARAYLSAGHGRRKHPDPGVAYETRARVVTEFSQPGVWSMTWR